MVHQQDDSAGVRLAELIASLSLATDLGMGQPMGHALRTCLLAVRLGEALGLTETALGEVYYLALLRRIGCTSDAHDLWAIFGDDLAAHARSFTLDFGQPRTVLMDMLRHAGAGGSPWDRMRAIGVALAAGPHMPDMLFRASCEVAQGLAEQLGFGPTIRGYLGQIFERWDGQGVPQHLQAEAIALPVRIVHVAEDVEVFHRLGGVDGAVAMLQRRAGASHDPAIAVRVCREAGRLLGELGTESVWAKVLAMEPGRWQLLTSDRLDAALEAMAAFTDLKTPYMTGHSSGVARLVAEAAKVVQLPAADQVAVRQAALVHDLGRVGVPNSVWEKPGPLTGGEWEWVRLHPYYTERVLGWSETLARLGTLAALHHERLDGSGYHRNAPATLQPIGARLLATADAYHAMGEARAHRPALSPEAAAGELRRQVHAGRLDGAAVDAVLKAAGHRVRRQRAWPAGLSAREVDVLRYVARGLSNRQIAQALAISEPTVAHHVQHIYTKLGVSTRAAATLFAMQRGLLSTVDLTE
jgi:HD-GYP domain-containing protein (c-di-GMP phosphodiesterase class II)